ncbi:MerR family transcriptional regulator [Microbacterium sp. ZW T5_56]|uniref:MerR family transcriptional regulator n=1 Tax=Microbacterium sp. ZW T5_56 TaxID=3378081 RepID=UPI003854EC58
MVRFTIGEFAALTGLTPKALRIYDRLDLLAPAAVDPLTGYRSYAPEQVERARLVAALRRVGVPLARIRTIADLPAAAAAAELTSYWRQTEADLRSRRGVVHGLIADLREQEIEMTTTKTPAARAETLLLQGGRAEQADAVWETEDAWAVADGFGPAGAAAAHRAIDEVRRAGHQAAGLEAAFATAAAETDADSGCTLTVVALARDVATIAHLGDSRAWLLREGVLRQLTFDHSEVATLVAEGRLSEEEARLHPRRAVLNRAIAAGLPTEPDVTGVRVVRGDWLLLSTDGVHAVLPPERIEEILTTATSVGAARDELAAAIEDAGAPDNAAAVIVEIGS